MKRHAADSIATAAFWQREALALVVLLAAMVALSFLAYQVPLFVRLAIGGDVQTHRRSDDAPFLNGFNASEPASDDTWQWWTLSPGYAYRWTTGAASIHLPGGGVGRWVISLHAASGRPDNAPTTSTWQVGEREPITLNLPASARVYHFLAPADAAGNLTIITRTPAYSPPGDPRELGFVLRDVWVAPAAGMPHLPAPAQVGWLAAALALLYGLARWLALARGPALLLGLLTGAGLAMLLAWQRLALTVFSPILVGLLLGCWVLAALVWLALGGWRAGTGGWWQTGTARRLLAVQRPVGAVLALALLAFALRAGGMLHPHAIFSDHRLHANNLLELARGVVYFTEGLPDSRGGGDSPYPPGFYVLLAPALTLVPPDIDSRVLIVQLGVALLDSGVVVLLWWLLLRAGLGQRAALCGAALYLLPPPMMASFSIGEYANLGGQILALPALALLAAGGLRAPPGGVPSTRMAQPAFLLALLLGMGLLGHMGVAISLALVMFAAWGLSVAAWVLRRVPPFSLAALTGGGLLAVLFVVCFYYSAPLFVEIFAQRFAGNATEATTSQPVLLALGGIVAGLFAPWSRLLPLTVAIGLVGAVLLARRGDSLGTTLTAWWLGVLLSFGLLLVAQQGVRWQHFLYPALCLGGGAALATFWRRGSAGRLAAGGILGIIIIHGLLLWVWHIYDYLH
jgi:hypothetical protein